MHKFHCFLIALSLFSVISLFSRTAMAGGNEWDQFLAQRARSLETCHDLDELIEAAGSARLALLGEASHGTHEYYVWRDSISRRLIEEKGFNFIAVEGDFASLFELNRYVKNLPGAASSAREVLFSLNRWPLWMWANQEVEGLAEWLRRYNDTLPDQKKIGFYGIDVYDEWRSMEAVLSFLHQVDPLLHTKALQWYGCMASFSGNSWDYARAVQQGMQPCTLQLQQVVQLLEENRDRWNHINDYDYFFALQNAVVKQNAEKFYRKSLTRQDASSWNARVQHMHQTVNRLLDLYGTGSRGIVWAHNTHVGDARFTDMFQARHQNIGQLSREHWGPEQVFIVGFTTYKGRVLAARQWDAPMQEMRIAPARRNSIEYILNRQEKPAYFVLFDDHSRTHPDLLRARGHRAVGVVFNPANEPRQYVNTQLSLRYDAIIFFHNTRALTPVSR